MPAADPPQVVVLSGPNGAGKSTVAPALLRDTLSIHQFVNADLIAAGLSPFASNTVALRSGEIMLRRIHELAGRGQSFAFETTLAARTYVPFLGQLHNTGYLVHLVYIWLESPELAIQRVRDRVARGGHNVPEEVIRRRYTRGLKNLFSSYLSLADTWLVCDNSSWELRFIAEAESGQEKVYDTHRWNQILELAR
jgi:predicted ABC-type ATPase